LNRPISSYHRQNGKRDEIDCKSSDNFDINLDNLISRLNNHIKKYKFKKSDILDNSTIYLDLDDFKEIFKRIRFEINQSELNSLFKYKNNSYEEGYIYGNVFLENCNLQELTLTEKTLEEHKYENNIGGRINKIDFKEINNQLKLIQNEVNDIVKMDSNSANKRVLTGNKIFQNKFDTRKNSAKNISYRDNISSSNTSEIKNTTFAISKYLDLIKFIKLNYFYLDNKNIQKNNANAPHLLPSLNPNPYITRPKSSAASKKIKSARTYLKETIKKQQLEKELLKLNIEKRNKENEREYIKKMTEANQLSIKLNLMKTYSAYHDEVFISISFKNN